MYLVPVFEKTNSASAALGYLNYQLKAQWQRAVEYARHMKTDNVDVASLEYERIEHSGALARFRYFSSSPLSVPATSNILFDGTFGEPKLEFVCNHEAFLTLKIDKARLNLRIPKSHSSSLVNGYQVEKDVDSIQATFHLPFRRHSAESPDVELKIAPFNNQVHLILLDLKSHSNIELIDLKSRSSLNNSVETALSFYLREYLDFLQQSGVGVLYEIPHANGVWIDYSPSATSKDAKVHSVGVHSINEYLDWSWQEALRRGGPSDYLSRCLAEISSTWVQDSMNNHFFIRFGAPKIEVLCPHEIYISFHVENIAWFESNNFTTPKVYRDWTVTFGVETVSKDGSIRAKLDTARLTDYSPRNADTLQYFELLVKFMKHTYCGLLAKYDYDIIYKHRPAATTITIPTYKKPGVTLSEAEITAWTKQVNFHNFDEIIALSERSINIMFQMLWDEKTRSQGDMFPTRWSTNQFEASFNPPVVRLLSDSRAVVWIRVESGKVTVIKESSRKAFWTFPPRTVAIQDESYERLSLTKPFFYAFEVNLKMTNDLKTIVGDVYNNGVGGLDIGGRLDAHNNVLKYLFLDLLSAKYVPSLSSISGPGYGREGLAAAEVMLQSLQRYLKELAHHGHNIVYSVPIWVNSEQKTDFALTNAAHRVVTKIQINSVDPKDITISRTPNESPVVLILAVTNHHTMPSIDSISWHDLWVVWGEKVLGSIYLSRSAILRKRLLTVLEHINRTTTLLPTRERILSHDREPLLVTWERDTYRSKQSCPWDQAQATHDSGEYRWSFYEEMAYSSGRSEESKTGYTISCSTSNRLTLPTADVLYPLDIELSGTSVVTVTGSEGGRTWRQKSIATWSSTIEIRSDVQGTHERVIGQSRPSFKLDKEEGECPFNVIELHKGCLPPSVEIIGVSSALQQVPLSQWTSNGLGLQRYVTAVPLAPAGGLVLQLLQNKSAEHAVPSTKHTISSDPVVIGNGTSALSTAATEETVNMNWFSKKLQELMIQHGMTGPVSSLIPLLQMSPADNANAAHNTQYPNNITGVPIHLPTS